MPSALFIDEPDDAAADKPKNSSTSRCSELFMLRNSITRDRSEAETSGHSAFTLWQPSKRAPLNARHGSAHTGQARAPFSETLLWSADELQQQLHSWDFARHKLHKPGQAPQRCMNRTDSSAMCCVSGSLHGRLDRDRLLILANHGWHLQEDFTNGNSIQQHLLRAKLANALASIQRLHVPWHERARKLQGTSMQETVSTKRACKTRRTSTLSQNMTKCSSDKLVRTSGTTSRSFKPIMST
jgi:hypothetical protein